MSIADRIFEDGIMADENSRTDLNFGGIAQCDREQYCYNKTKDRFETINAMHDIAKQPNTNQLNNKQMSKKMREKLMKKPEPVVETRK